MALNKEVFKTRATTAVVFVLVMLAGFFINHWSFFLLFSIIHFGCWWEYFNLGEKIHQTNFHRFTRFGFMLAGFALVVMFANWKYSIGGYQLSNSFSMPLSLAGFVLMAIGIFMQKQNKLNAYLFAFLGVVYISLSWALYIDLAQIFNNPDAPWRWTLVFLPLFTIGCMWVNDTMAYLVGSFIGKTPFSKISPKKTWEGTIGGVILCGIIMAFIGRSWDNASLLNFSFVQWLLMAVVMGVVGTAGDLLESKLKRMADVKDSGTFMPGHGGFLDRFDSLIVGAPIMWLMIQLMHH
jgi:phosphatidate cytidylyltransferase